MKVLGEKVTQIKKLLKFIHILLWFYLIHDILYHSYNDDDTRSCYDHRDGAKSLEEILKQRNTIE